MDFHLESSAFGPDIFTSVMGISIGFTHDICVGNFCLLNPFQFQINTVTLEICIIYLCPDGNFEWLSTGDTARIYINFSSATGDRIFEFIEESHNI